MDSIQWENAAAAVEAITEVLKTRPPDVCYEQVRIALQQYPDTAELHSIAGVCFLLQENNEKALEYFCEAARLEPRELRYLVNQAELLVKFSREDEAMEIFHHVLGQDPRYETAYIGIGNIYQANDELEMASAQFARAVRFNPKSVAARNNFASTLVRLQNYEEALSETEKILKLQPDHKISHRRMVKILVYFSKFDEAKESLDRAIQYFPEDSFLLHELGKLYDRSGQPAMAIQYMEKAHRLDPTDSNLTLNLGKVLHDAGRIEDAVAVLLPAAKKQKGNDLLWSNLLMVSQYTNQIDRDAKFKLHRVWGEHIESITEPMSLPDPSQEEPDKVLRIGLVSADLREHPVGYFLQAMVKNLPEDICFYGYHNTSHHDDLTDYFKNHFAGWHEIADVPDSEVAQKIQEDQIDILFDLAGHTSGNRLPLFALKPAPIQITGLGYVDTTGLTRMDYIVSDAFQSPENEDIFYTERVWRRKGDYIVYAPPQKSPLVAALPALTNDYVTFGSCNKPAKLSDETILLWSKTLLAVPKSRLLLRNVGLDQPGIQNSLCEKFEAQGVERERIKFLGGASHEQLLATYNQIDIGLDPTPYSGGLTTLEAVWMGVPVVTRGGSNFASRHSMTHLNHCGLPQWVHDSDDSFIDHAKYWAENLEALSNLRHQLRAQLLNSPACDGKQYTEDFAAFAREIWKAYLHKSNESWTT